MLKILKTNISDNYLYNDLCKLSYDTFSKFKDDDFFSDKVQHIYFYSGINDDSIHLLQMEIMEASKTIVNESGIQSSPKPICIHINSIGGYVNSSQTFYTIIQSIRTPLCTIIENKCASAATIFQLLSPYRLMIHYSNYLIHDMAGGYDGKTSEVIKYIYHDIHSCIHYKELIKNRTKLNDSDINTFFERDITVDAKYCLKNGIIDKILKFPKIKNPDYYSNVSNLQLNLGSFLKKTNLNHLYFDKKLYETYYDIVSSDHTENIQNVNSINHLCKVLDNIFLIHKNDNIKPIIIHFRAATLSFDPMNLVGVNYRLAQIQKRIPIIAFIEGYQQFDSLSSIMMCPIRIMMKPSIIQSTFSYGNLSFGYKTIDVINNSIFHYNQIVKFYKENTQLPKSLYSEMRNKIINLDVKYLLKYKIIHLCLNINKKNKDINIQDIIKYFRINSMIDNKKGNDKKGDSKEGNDKKGDNKKGDSKEGNDKKGDSKKRNSKK